MADQTPQLSEDTKVTLRFAAFVVMNIVLVTGGWYNIKNDTQVLKDQLVDQRSEIKELRSNSTMNTTDRAEMKKDIAVLNEQMGQLKELRMIVIQNTNGSTTTGTVILAPQKNGKR